MNEMTVGGLRSIPIQTFLDSVEPDQSTRQLRSTAVISAVKVSAAQPLTIIPPGSGCHEIDTHGVVYQRLHESRPSGKSQLATTSWACADDGTTHPISSTADTAIATRAVRKPLQIGKYVGAILGGGGTTDRRPHIGRCQSVWLPALLRGEDEHYDCDHSRHERDDQVDAERQAEDRRHFSPVAGVALVRPAGRVGRRRQTSLQ